MWKFSRLTGSEFQTDGAMKLKERSPTDSQIIMFRQRSTFSGPVSVQSCDVLRCLSTRTEGRLESRASQEKHCGVLRPVPTNNCLSCSNSS